MWAWFIRGASMYSVWIDARCDSAPHVGVRFALAALRGSVRCDCAPFSLLPVFSWVSDGGRREPSHVRESDRFATRPRVRRRNFIVTALDFTVMSLGASALAAAGEAAQGYGSFRLRAATPLFGLYRSLWPAPFTTQLSQGSQLL
ncbi:uncharacterized [Tachysurus ichikawai]